MNEVVAGNDHEFETTGSPYAVGGFTLYDGREIMKDMSSMLFGDILDNKNGAIKLRVEVYPNYDDDDDDDGKLTVISSKTHFVLKLDKMMQERFLPNTDLPNFCIGSRYQ